MGKLRFEWDDAKAGRNLGKHGISFEEASSVFFDEKGRLIHDPDDVGEESRYILLGMSASLRVLVVSHTYRDEDRVIRIISARRAEPSEREDYGRAR